ncbi:MAG: hypothetical protein KDI61_03130 [Alphaproteobacteria bacterium]|nr:hypothetical protein [Alphaproteobacteria bacterium]
MKRFFLSFSVLVLLFSLACPRLALAQQKIAVRSGEHEDYSRVVFDWGRAVDYSLDQSHEKLLIIRFKEQGKTDLSGFDPSKLANVTGFRVIKNDPLTVSMIIPDKSKVNAFLLSGNRIVVDVYAPSKQEPNKAEETKPPPQQQEVAKTGPVIVPEKKPETQKPEAQKTEEKPEPAPEPEKVAQKEPEAQPVEKTPAAPAPQQPETAVEKTPPVQEFRPPPQPETQAAIPKELPHSSPPDEKAREAYTLRPPEKNEGFVMPDLEPRTTTNLNYKLVPQSELKSKPPAQEKLEEPKPAETEKKEENTAAKTEQAPPKIEADPAAMHVLTVTSTSSVGLAVFENRGDLWLVTDRDSGHLKPVINSKTPYIFGEMKDQPLEGGRAYRTSAPSGYQIKAKGGELSWKVILDKQDLKLEPVEPKRITRGGNFSRGGKLVIPLKDFGTVLEMTDPQSGQKLSIVTVKNADQYTGPAQDFVDFTLLKSVVGLAVLPKVDDLSVDLTEQGVEITRPGGLALLPEKVIGSALMDSEGPPSPYKGSAAADTGPRIFNFAEWQRIPFDSLEHNKNIVLASLPEYSKASRAEDLIALAKAYLLSGMGAEALGFLNFAGQELPDIVKNPEFIALRGMANAFDGKSDIALADLQREELKPYLEVGYWKAYVLADLGDWQQAIDVLPENLAAFYEYPGLVSRRLALVLAEVLLRAGRIDKADELLALVDYYKSELDEPMKASLSYLRGESARQKGQKQKALDIWKELETGKDDLFRVKAGLAITRLLDEEGAITNDKVIDRLERLRYAWRGDEIEALVNYWLGNAYFKKKEYVKGLGIMRDAAEVAGETELGRRVAADMSKTFADLFLGPDLKNLSALDAIALYEQFSELTPPGETGDRLVRNLAEHLVKADLLARAANLLENQVNHRLKGEEKAQVAKRLTVIYLLDRQPQKALQTLDKMQNTVKLLPEGPKKEEMLRDMILLHSRAYAQDNRAEQALALLKDMKGAPDVNRLRADISWQAGYWAEAADALAQVLEDQHPGASGPLTEKQSQVIMNLAVALNLSNDRIAIANLRERYQKAMSGTPKAHQFEVITRPRRNTVLADRETLMSVVSEVDLFKEFLDAYKSQETSGESQTAPPGGK